MVRKAYRTVFKRVIRPLLNRNFSNQLPLCTSNHCIVLPGVAAHILLLLPLQFVKLMWRKRAGLMPVTQCSSVQESEAHPALLLGFGGHGNGYLHPKTMCKQMTLPAVVCAVGMEDIHMHATPPDNKDPNAPWYHMPANGLGEASSIAGNIWVP